ncbi:MAG: galactokinase family protein [Verrucomicrobiota bacterium]
MTVAASTTRPLDIQTVFKRHFGYTPTHVVQAPGRLEVLGNHTDYNQGLVMSVAIDRYVWMAASPRTDAKVELVTSAFTGHESFWISELKKKPTAPWADYVKGVLDRFRKHGVHFGGFNAAIHSNLPMGAGLGSSGALMVAAALLLRQLFPYKVTESGVTRPPKRDRRGLLPPLTPKEKMQIARLCAAAENHFVGLRAGMLDEISSLCGKEFHVMEIDFMHNTVELFPMIGEFAIVVLDTGVKHELVSSRYNELREHSESAARKLGVRSLRSVELNQLDANRARLSDREYECAFHIMAENLRVVHGERALLRDDIWQLGQFMFQSHDSSRDFLKNSCDELDLLVKLAREHPACLGARLTGGGFGGATINLIAWSQVDSFIKTIGEHYESRTGKPLKAMRCRVVDGAE